MPTEINHLQPPTRFTWAEVLRLLLLIGLATLLLPGLGAGGRPVLAQNRSVEYANIDITLDLEEDGSFHLTERQVVEFTGGSFSNGMREISRTRTESIGNVSVGEEVNGEVVPYEFVIPAAFNRQPGTFTAENQGNNIRLDWSFPPTRNDERTFVIEYDVVGALRVYETSDPPFQRITWLAIGPELTENVPVRDASFTINLPEPLELSEVEYSPADQEPAVSNGGRSWTWTASDLSGGEAFDVGLTFPPMVAAAVPAWQEASDAQEVREADAEERNAVVSLIAIGVGVLALVGGGIGIFGLWYTRGRDPHVGPVADFLPTPPDDLPPGVAGTLVDEIAGEHEFVATMVDLAKRGILRINEVSSGGVLGIGASRDFDLTLLDPDQPRASFETDLLQAIFGHTLTKDAAVKLSDVKSRVDTARPAILNDLYAELVSRGYFPSSPNETRSHWRTMGWVIVVGAIVLAFILTGPVSIPPQFIWPPAIVIAVLGFFLVMFSGSMPKKTHAGAEAAARWLAFKRYLDSIENYEDLNEAKDIFERYLPFAIAFRLDRSWVQKFAAVQTPAPAWYDDGGTIFMPGTYGPGGGLGRQRHRGFGGNVIVLPGGGWPGGGGSGSGSGGEIGGDGGGFGLPDLQGGSDSAGRSLQNASSGLFDLFNTASSVFGGGSSGGRGWGGGGGGGGGFSGGGGGSSGGGGGGFS